MKIADLDKDDARNDRDIFEPVNIDDEIDAPGLDNYDDDNEHEDNIDEDTNTQPSLRRSGRHLTRPNRLAYEYTLSDDSDEDVAAMYSFVDGTPKYYGDEIDSVDGHKWKQSMQVEYDALIKNGTWS